MIEEIFLRNVKIKKNSNSIYVTMKKIEMIDSLIMINHYRMALKKIM